MTVHGANNIPLSLSVKMLSYLTKLTPYPLPFLGQRSLAWRK